MFRRIIKNSWWYIYFIISNPNPVYPQRSDPDPVNNGPELDQWLQVISLTIQEWYATAYSLEVLIQYSNKNVFDVNATAYSLEVLTLYSNKNVFEFKQNKTS